MLLQPVNLEQRPDKQTSSYRDNRYDDNHNENTATHNVYLLILSPLSIYVR